MRHPGIYGEDTNTQILCYTSLVPEAGSEKKKMIAKAGEYLDNVSQKEKYYIRSLKAYMSGNYAQAIKELKKLMERYPENKFALLWLGVIYEKSLRETEEAVPCFTKVIEIDPLHKEAYNQFAYTYVQIGNFEKSIWAINKYISLAPDEANPYDRRGELYARNGKIDKAIESFKKALEIKPGFFLSLVNLGDMYLFKREYAEAESYYKQICSSSEKDIRSTGRTLLAYIPIYQGKFEEALKVLDDGIAADRMEQTGGWENAIKHLFKAIIYAEKKKSEFGFKGS